MRFNGQLSEWNDDRGFGFALVPGQAERVFVHIKAFEGNPRRPEVRDMLTFETSAGPKGPVAKRIRHARTEDKALPVRASGRRAFIIDWAVTAVLVPLQIFAVSELQLPLWKWALLPLAALWAFIAFNWDKGAARRNERRVSEANLLLLSIPGWIGAVAAQQLFRHKSSKHSFYYKFRAIGVIQIGVITWLLWRGF